MMETVIVTLKMPADLFSLVKKYAKGCIIKEHSINTSSITNTSNCTTTSNEINKTLIPDINDVVVEVKNTGSKVNPQRFYDYYQRNNWCDKSGNQIDWKKKLAEWGTYNIEKSPSKNDSPKCDFRNDASFKNSVADLLSESKKEGAA